MSQLVWRKLWPDTIGQNRKKAMEIEYNSLMKNGTWEMIGPSKGANVIREKWVFKLKKDRFGNIPKYKVQWVEYRFKPNEKLDYLDIFADVVKDVSYKCLFAVRFKRSYLICYMDVVNTFHYGFLDEVIYRVQLVNTPCMISYTLKLIADTPIVTMRTLYLQI